MTKMIYPLNYKKGNNSLNKRNVLIVLVVFLILILIRTFFFKNLFINISNTLNKQSDKVFVFFKNIPSWFVNRENLIERIDELEKQNYLLKLNTVDNLAIDYENKRLRTQLNSQPQAKKTIASVIKRPPFSNFDSFVINKGAKDNISVGDMVALSNKIFVGRVVEVNEKSSVVMTDSLAGNSVVVFSSRTGDVIEIKGSGGGNLSAKLPISIDIKEGDDFLISYDSAYIVATVGFIKTNESMGLKEVFMTLPFDINKLDSVFVITEI